MIHSTPLPKFVDRHLKGNGEVSACCWPGGVGGQHTLCLGVEEKYGLLRGRGDQVSVICEGRPLCPDVPGGHMPGTDLHLPCLWAWAAALVQEPMTYGLRGLRFRPSWWGRGVLDGCEGVKFILCIFSMGRNW